MELNFFMGTAHSKHANVHIVTHGWLITWVNCGPTAKWIELIF